MGWIDAPVSSRPVPPLQGRAQRVHFSLAAPRRGRAATGVLVSIRSAGGQRPPVPSAGREVS
ncbi:MAG: hypothetical protein ACREQ5_17765, partial [Candidatus Dormibacteria bacterium]